MIDLRSDLLSRPSPAMRRAIVAALERPAAFGLREDADQRALERAVADRLGTEDALLFPTCSMANEAALLALTRPGDLVLAQPDVHLLTSEAGAPAALAGVQIVAVDAVDCCPPADAWRARLVPVDDPLKARVAAVALENTHNRAGGLAWAPAYGAAVLAAARAHGVAAHLDGSRLPNAAVALGVAPDALAAGFDTVALSLNKGLGAPLGAALAGRGTTIARALALRQRLGGGWRPTALVAAPARVALEEDWAHIADDHRRASRLAAALAATPGLLLDATRVTTNIVVADLAGDLAADADAVVVALADAGVLALAFGPRRLRFVTYRGLTDDDVDRAAAAAGRALARFDPISRAVTR
ncbi:MAG: low specificity L-threonine aldolase [Lautropia sp.]